MLYNTLNDETFKSTLAFDDEDGNKGGCPVFPTSL